MLSAAGTQCTVAWHKQLHAATDGTRDVPERKTKRTSAIRVEEEHDVGEVRTHASSNNDVTAQTPQMSKSQGSRTQGTADKYEVAAVQTTEEPGARRAKTKRCRPSCDDERVIREQSREATAAAQQAQPQQSQEQRTEDADVANIRNDSAHEAGDANMRIAERLQARKRGRASGAQQCVAGGSGCETDRTPPTACLDVGYNYQRELEVNARVHVSARATSNVWDDDRRMDRSEAVYARKPKRKKD